MNQNERIQSTLLRSVFKEKSSCQGINGHVERFLDQFPRYLSWCVEKVSLALPVSDDVRKAMAERGWLVQADGATSASPGMPYRLIGI